LGKRIKGKFRDVKISKLVRIYYHQKSLQQYGGYSLQLLRIKNTGDKNYVDRLDDGLGNFLECNIENNFYRIIL
jgi:hypothetical protein